MKLKLKKLTSLDKVFLHKEPSATCEPIRTVLANEAFSFQIAWFAEAEEADGHHAPYVRVTVEEDYGGAVRLKEVGHVPSELPAYPNADDDYLTKLPGLFPDPLYELEDGIVRLVANQWRSLWVEFHPDGRLPAGTYPIRVTLADLEGRELATVEHTVEVLGALLPKQELIHTEWLHYDCLAQWYGVEPLSEPHWELIERYIKTAVDHGVNMILTPLFTPPLDTKIGGERLTVQLVGVSENKGRYTFDFSRLKRFIDMARRQGIEYFEMSHLFTQWGALAAPKIVAESGGELRRIFGWDTEASDPAYKAFLDSFLPELTAALREWGVADRVWFHVSDEPHRDHLESYRAARNLVEPHLRGFRMIDALSDFDFYAEGLVKTPVPANDCIEPFLAAQVPNLWTYYCCMQYRDVSNRFMAMPSRRNRILGAQLYKFSLEGFLHWGYNFWNSQYSVKPIHPYAVTDAGCAFPSGDAFLVYPGENGKPVESIRLKVLREALYDLRAMQLLERLTSREFVLNILEDGGSKPITFKDYPREESYLTAVRTRINEEIAIRSR